MAERLSEWQRLLLHASGAHGECQRKYAGGGNLYWRNHPHRVRQPRPLDDHPGNFDYRCLLGRIFRQPLWRAELLRAARQEGHSADAARRERRCRHLKIYRRSNHRRRRRLVNGESSPWIGCPRSASQSTHGLGQRPQFAQRRSHRGHLHRSTSASRRPEASRPFR